MSIAPVIRNVWFDSIFALRLNGFGIYNGESVNAQLTDLPQPHPRPLAVGEFDTGSFERPMGHLVDSNVPDD
jgi:hypothetical protein